MNFGPGFASSPSELRTILDLVPEVVVAADFANAMPELQRLRAEGIHDPATHVQFNPDVADRLLATVRVTEANRAALTFAGYGDAQELRRLTGDQFSRPLTILLTHALALLANQQPRAGTTAIWNDERGRRRCCRIEVSASASPQGPDWSHVVISAFDPTIASAASTADEDREIRAEIFARANLLLWRARVHRADGKLVWRFTLPANSLSSRLFPFVSSDRGFLWDDTRTPDLATMTNRAATAIETGAPGYQHEFRVIHEGRTHWLAEDVTIQPISADAWSLVGVISDVTGRREAEDARRRSEAHLHNLLARADCMLWSARVTAVGDGFRWEVDVPRSGLQRRIFGDIGDLHYVHLPDSGAQTLYGHHMIPEAAEKHAREEAAFRSGASGYQTEFRVITPEQTFWLQEQVTIERTTGGGLELVGVTFDVTDLHAVENERRQSATQIRQLLERADCMLWHARVVDIQGALQWRFKVALSGLQRRLFRGDPPEAIVGMHGTTDNSPYGPNVMLDQEEMDQRSSRALRARHSGYEQEFRIQSPDQLFWLHEQVTITPVGPEEWDLVGIVLDVTARHKAEEARRATEERLQQLLTRADCMIWEARIRENQEGNIEWAFFVPNSNLYRELFGTDPDPVHPRMWTTIDVPEMEQMRARSRRALRTGQSGYVQEFRCNAPHQTYWLREQVTLSRGGPGYWYAVGVVTDITARRMAEAALDAEKERLAVTLRAMSEGVITSDRHGRVQFLNRAAAELVGCRIESAVGRPLQEVCAFFDHHSHAAYHLPLAQVLGEGVMLDLPPHTILRHPSGRNILVAGRCVPVRDAASTIIGTVLVLADITERQRLDEQLQRASKLESVGILAGGIAHDFNNILTAIMGNISLAMLDGAEESPTHRNLRDAQAATLRARDLTQQLLTFAKGGDPVKSVVSLPQVITEVARFALHGSPVGCEFDLPRDLWAADADKGQFAQIVQNLVINAVQAMPNGGLLRITGQNTTVSLDANLPVNPGDYVHLMVSDTGSGIGPENLNRIFDPYFTTKQHGTGLGLATVYSIVRRHGGHIEVESEIGRGSTFHIWIPALRTEVPAPPAAEPGQTRGLHGRALFMDDEPAIRKLGAVLLRRLGLDVEVAADGAETIELFKAAQSAGRPFDVVVMDLTVPGGMGGREALEELRKLDPQVRAIVSSGYSSDQVLANHRAFGFCGMVAKPYQVENFARVLREALARSDASDVS